MVLKRKGKQKILSIVVQAKQRLKCMLDDHLRKIDSHGNIAMAITFTGIKTIKEVMAISLRWCFYLENSREENLGDASNWLWIRLLKQNSNFWDYRDCGLIFNHDVGKHIRSSSNLQTERIERARVDWHAPRSWNYLFGASALSKSMCSITSRYSTRLEE